MLWTAIDIVNKKCLNKKRTLYNHHWGGTVVKEIELKASEEGEAKRNYLLIGSLAAALLLAVLLGERLLTRLAGPDDSVAKWFSVTPSHGNCATMRDVSDIIGHLKKNPATEVEIIETRVGRNGNADCIEKVRLRIWGPALLPSGPPKPQQLGRSRIA